VGVTGPARRGERNKEVLWGEGVGFGGAGGAGVGGLSPLSWRMQYSGGVWIGGGLRRDSAAAPLALE